MYIHGNMGKRKEGLSDDTVETSELRHKNTLIEQINIECVAEYSEVLHSMS